MDGQPKCTNWRFAITGVLIMSNIIKGVEIFATGTWKGHVIKQNDLVQMARNQQTLGTKIRVPLKFGHNDEQPLTDGQPALGWVTRLRLIGNKLVADFEQVPDLVHKAIKSGLYDRVSSEVLFGVKLGEQEIGTVLVGVALLGADLPAVSDLEGLGALLASFHPVPGETQVFSFSAGTDVDRLAMEDNRGADNQEPHEEEINMDELKELKKTMEGLQASVSALKTNYDAEKVRADAAEAKLEAFRKQEEIQKSEQVAVLFTSERRNIIDQCEALVKAGKMQPALRDKIEVAVEAGRASFSLENPKINFPSELVMEMAKSFSGELPGGEQGQGSGQGQGQGDKLDETPDITLDRLIRKYMAEHKLDPRDQAEFQEAHIAVLGDERNRELADKYEAFISTATAN